MCGMLPELQKAIKISIEIPSPEASAELAPSLRRIKLKKKSDKKDGIKSVDDVELGDTLMRDMLPDMASKFQK